MAVDASSLAGPCTTTDNNNFDPGKADAMTTPAPEIPLGARVAVAAGLGYVRWTGANPAFSAGKWVGIELDTPTGKNDGSVQGESYFECRANYGVFVRPSQVRVMSANPSKPRPGPLAKAHTASSSSISRLSSGSASRSSTPGSRPAGVSTPTRATPTRPRPSVTAPTPPRTASAGSAAGSTTRTVKRTIGAPGAARARASISGPSVRAPAGAAAARRQSSIGGAGLSAPTPGDRSSRSSISEPTRRQSLAPSSGAATPASEGASQPSRTNSGLGLGIPSPQPRPSSSTSPRPPSARSTSSIPSPVQKRSGLPSPAIQRPGLARQSSSEAMPPPPLPAPTPQHADSGSAELLTSPLPIVQSPTQSPTAEEYDLNSPTEPEHPDVSPTAPPKSLGGSTSSPLLSPRQARNMSVRSSSPEAAAVFAQKRELEELRIKVRLLETRRHEDQERIKSLEKVSNDADQLHAVRAKLQAKFQEQQQALGNAQRQARDLQSENAHMEAKMAEFVDQLEMATLDREVAEEKAEAAEAELDRLNEKVQELELEVSVLKEENEQYERPIEGLEGERTSLAFVQLENHNQRLKEALIRLRDLSQDTEREHKTKIAELEKELTEQQDVSAELELTEAKLANSEAQVEDLKQQLDDALGAEDLLEELTERNLQMSEKIEEMRATIEDLEALKELSDELEENHVETEKQLEEEITMLTNKLREEVQRAVDLEAVVVDMENTIGQFRELVANLQSEIDTLRVQQATQEYESATASKESQALLNLNMKLQSSAAKTLRKTVDLELKKLEAAQLTEHLRIVQTYLPDEYLDTEIDSTTALLFFHRVSSKVEMLTNVISNVHGLPGALHTVESEALVGICELRGKLRSFAMLNRRFASVMRRASPEDYGELGRVVSELHGVEPKVDGWIASAKADEFNEGECARELDALLSQFRHLSEVMFDRGTRDAGERQLALAYSFEDDLDNFAAAVGFVRAAVKGLVADGDVDVDTGESTLEEALYEPVQTILNQVRAVKAPAGKLVAIVEDVVANKSSLVSEFTAALGDQVVSVSNAVDIAVQLAQRIGAHVAATRSSKEPLKLADIEKFCATVVAENVGSSDLPPWEVIASFVTRLGTDLHDMLPKFRNATKAGQIISLDVEAPWLARVQAIKEAASHNAEAERKLSRLQEDLKDTLREVKLREQSLEESGIKIETLERRLEASKRQADQITELEEDLQKARKQEKMYEEALEQLQTDQDHLEAENARLRKHGVPEAEGEKGETVKAVEARGMIEQIEALRGAIRFLRSENSLLKSKDLYEDVRMLKPLRTLPAVPAVPDLVNDAESDAESEGPVTPKPRTPKAPTSPLAKGANTRHALDTETKLLYKELARFSAAPRIVDLSGFDGKGPAWRSRKNSPEAQAWRWTMERVGLEKKVEDLATRVKALKRY